MASARVWKTRTSWLWAKRGHHQSSPYIGQKFIRNSRGGSLSRPVHPPPNWVGCQDEVWKRRQIKHDTLHKNNTQNLNMQPLAVAEAFWHLQFITCALRRSNTALVARRMCIAAKPSFVYWLSLVIVTSWHCHNALEQKHNGTVHIFDLRCDCQLLLAKVRFVTFHVRLLFVFASVSVAEKSSPSSPCALFMATFHGTSVLQIVIFSNEKSCTQCTMIRGHHRYHPNALFFLFSFGEYVRVLRRNACRVCVCVCVRV